MNYYKRHLGDYARDTGHLSALEHGIYNLLLDWYYVNEKPIPPDKAVKIARGNPEETQSVLSEFFLLGDAGWIHKYADREIAKYRVKADRNRDIGKLGGRPVKSMACESNNPEITQKVSAGNPDVTLATNPLIHNSKKEQDQEPLHVSLREPAKKSAKGSRLHSDWIPSEAMLAYAAANRPDVNAQAEAENFRDYWIAKPGAGGVKLDWEATWRTWVRRANAGHARASPLVNGKPSAAADFRNSTYTGTPYDELPPELR